MARFELITGTTGKGLTVGKLPTAMLIAGLCWVLTNGSLASWLVGLPAVAGAVWANARLSGTSGSRTSGAITGDCGYCS